MSRSASKIGAFDSITATVLQYSAFIAVMTAITTAITYITAELDHQSQEFPQLNTSESYPMFLTVAAVATTCCGFLLLGFLLHLSALLAFPQQIIAAKSYAATAGTITPKPTKIRSSLDAPTFQGLKLLKQQNRRGCDSEIFTDGYADTGDSEDCSMRLTSKTVRAAAIRKRIALLRERRRNAPVSNDDADNALFGKPTRLTLSSPSSSSAGYSEITQGSDDDDNSGIDRIKSHRDDSAREITVLDTTPELVVDNGGILPNPAETTMSDDALRHHGVALPLRLQPSSRPPPGEAHPRLIDATEGIQRSPLSRALLKIIPGLPPRKSFRMSRRISKSHRCSHENFPSTVGKSDFWHSLGDKPSHGAGSCNRPCCTAGEIMSVCNDPTTQRILAKILVAGHGFGFCSMYSGEDALEELKDRYKAGGKESLPMVILMDTTLMCGMDGYETTQKIRSLFPDVALPILMLSDSSDLEITTFQKALEAGANDLVTQPITKQNLMVRIGFQLKALHFWRAQLESRQIEYLLKEILPKNIITKLKHGHTGCIYEELEQVSVIFTDIVSFTSLSASHPTEEIIHMLDSLFTEFDMLTDKHGLYKVETIGEKTLADINPVVSSLRHRESDIENSLTLIHYDYTQHTTLFLLPPIACFLLLLLLSESGVLCYITVCWSSMVTYILRLYCMQEIPTW